MGYDKKRVSVLIDLKDWDRLKELTKTADSHSLKFSDHFREALRLYLQMKEVEQRSLNSEHKTR